MNAIASFSNSIADYVRSKPTYIGFRDIMLFFDHYAESKNKIELAQKLHACAKSINGLLNHDEELFGPRGLRFMLGQPQEQEMHVFMRSIDDAAKASGCLKLRLGTPRGFHVHSTVIKGVRKIEVVDNLEWFNNMAKEDDGHPAHHA